MDKEKILDKISQKIIRLYGNSYYQKPRKERAAICRQAFIFFLKENGLDV
jgi:hypothetical protein